MNGDRRSGEEDWEKFLTPEQRDAVDALVGLGFGRSHAARAIMKTEGKRWPPRALQWLSIGARGIPIERSPEAIVGRALRGDVLYSLD